MHVRMTLLYVHIKLALRKFRKSVLFKGDIEFLQVLCFVNYNCSLFEQFSELIGLLAHLFGTSRLPLIIINAIPRIQLENNFK